MAKAGTAHLSAHAKAGLNYEQQQKFILSYREDDDEAPFWLRVRPTFGFADWREQFLQELALHGQMTTACLALGVRVTVIYKYIARCRAQGTDDEFLEAMEIALTYRREHLELSMLQRAHAGDTFAGIFMLKAMDPEKYDRPRQLNQKIDRQEHIQLDVRATMMDYRQAVAELAPPAPETIEGEVTELLPSPPVEED